MGAATRPESEFIGTEQPVGRCWGRARAEGGKVPAPKAHGAHAAVTLFVQGSQNVVQGNPNVEQGNRNVCAG
jgi:hypothetical protein